MIDLREKHSKEIKELTEDHSEEVKKLRNSIETLENHISSKIELMLKAQPNSEMTSLQL
jgi:hypothetical protein